MTSTGRLAAMAAAPYLAVFVGLYYFQHAALSILLYHGQVALWRLFSAQRSDYPVFQGWSARDAAMVILPVTLSAPILILLMPIMIQPGLVLSAWLTAYGLEGPWLWVFAAYFGLVHPLIEEIHWAPVRQRLRPVWCVHLAFAFYHVPVLQLLLQLPWAILAGALLFAASWIWAILERKHQGTLLPILSHTTADAVIIATVLLMAVNGAV